MLTKASARRVLVAASVSLLALFVTGITTSMIPNPWFTRMTRVTWWSRPTWVVTSILIGILASTFIDGRRTSRPLREAAGGGVLMTLAIGCPTCNRLVVVILGMSGALNFWSPIQPVLAIASIAMLLFAISRRTRSNGTCSIESSHPVVTPTAQTSEV